MAVPVPLNAAVPEETIRVARVAFPKGNVFIRMHDVLGPLYCHPQFSALFSHRAAQRCERQHKQGLITSEEAALRSGGGIVWAGS